MDPKKSRPIGNRWFLLALFFAIGILVVNGWHVFTGGGEWAVRATFIPGNGGEVGGKEKLYWRFDKPLFFQAETPFSLPTWDEIPGTFAWTAPGLLVFAPRQDWPVGRNFRISFPRDFPPGCRLQGPGTWKFSSAPTMLEEAGQIEVDSRDRATLLLGFNSPVDPRDLPDCLTVFSGKETALEWRALDRSPGKRIRILTGSIPPGGEALELRYRPPALPGETEEKPTSVRRLSIEHHMVLREIEPFVENGKIVFEANFSQIPSVAQAADYLTVEPPLPVTVGKSEYCWKDNAVLLRGDFEPGCLYTIRFREGMPAASGRRTETDQARRVRAPDLPPSIRFRDPGSILAAGGTRLLRLEAVNIPSFRARLKRIYPNNLVQFMMRERRNYSGWWGEPENEICAPTVEREYRAGGERNRPLQIDLDLGTLAGDKARGVFVCGLSSSEERARDDQRLVMITDIGLSARLYGGEVLVWANSVLEARPVAGARVTVLSTANRTLGTGSTDDHGTALIALEPAAGDRPFLILAETDRDLACLVLEEPVSCFEEASLERPWPAEKPEAFLETDRGVYRGGETVRWYTVVRTDGVALPPSFPIQIKLADPDGREMDAAVRITGELGTAEGGIILPVAAPSGAYRLSLHVPGEKEALGETRILVADFVPPRLEASVEAGRNPVEAGEATTLTVKARYLYGAPAAGNRVRARLSYRKTPLEIPGREHWRFGDRELSFTPPPAWEGEDRLNREGETAFPFAAAGDLRPGEGLAADFEATVLEEGGRGLTVGETITIHAYPRYVGIRGIEENESLDAGDERRVDVAVFSPQGELLRGNIRLRATLEEIVWESLLKKDDDGRYRYVSERRLQPADDYEINLREGTGSFPVQLPGWGRYLLKIHDPEGGAPVSVRFHGIGKNRQFLDSSLEEPERIDLSFERTEFLPGETPELCLRAPFPGRALVTVESDRLLYRNVLVLEENCAAVPLPVPADAPPGSRCFVSILRPLADRETPGPRRACGSLTLPLEMEAHRIRIEIDVPAQAEPGDELPVEIRLTDENGRPAQGEVLITAVDRGILDLTGFGLPDPYSFFYEPLRKAAELFDVYNRLLPERLPGVTAIPAPGGGDGGIAGRLNPVPAVRFKPFAVVSGPLSTDDEGRVSYRLPLGDFSGALRIGVTAVTETGSGAAETGVEVRAPLALEFSLPRFLAPGDECDLTVRAHNLSGNSGTARIELQSDPPLFLAGTAGTVSRPLEDGETTVWRIRLRAAATAGTGRLRIISGIGEHRRTDSVEIAVRPPVPAVSEIRTVVLEEGQATRISPPDGFLPGTETLRLRCSVGSAVNLEGGLEYLFRYPYGCVEQTASCTFPLLYLPAVPGAEDGQENARELVEAGLKRLYVMQLPDGSFSYWPGGDRPCEWATPYVTRLLVEAGKAGYQVPPERLETALAATSRILSPRSGEKGEEARKATACLVMALAGKSDSGWARRLLEEEETLPLSARIELGGALAARGETGDALGVLERAAPLVRGGRDPGGDNPLASGIGTLGHLIVFLIECDPRNSRLPDLIDLLTREGEAGHWRNTPDNAAAVEALAKWANMREGSGRPALVRIETAAGAAEHPLDDETDWKRSWESGERPPEIAITNRGPGFVRVRTVQEGVPLLDRLPRGDAGIRLRRTWLTPEGETVAGEDFRQGDFLVAALRLDSGAERLKNLVIEDLLPAGFEVENTALAGTRSLDVGRFGSTLPVTRVEERDDRVIVFTGSTAGVQTYYYGLRAVSAGDYTVPPARVEGMYQPEIRSVSGGGRVRVLPAEEAGAR